MTKGKADLKRASFAGSKANRKISNTCEISWSSIRLAEKEELSFVQSFQELKVNGSFSSWKDLTRGVHQGSVLTLLFNICINDLLLFIENSDTCNYADDITIYSYDWSLDNIIHKLENDCNVALKWFADNFMKLKADTCHLLHLVQRCDYPVTVKIGNTDVVNSSEEKLLRVHVDSKLSFYHHVSNFCQKASNKIYALPRISPYMDQNKLRNLMREFIISQFQYLSFDLDISQ